MKSSLMALAALCLLAAAPAHAEGFLRAENKQIVDATGKPILLRGMGLGGWMLQEGYMLNAGGLPQHRIKANIDARIGPEKTEIFYQAWRDNFITQADIDAMASYGFNSVRLPMHWNLYIDETQPGIVWREEGFAMTDRLIGWAKARGMYVILDLHAAPGGQGNDVPISDRDVTKPSLWEDPANQDKMVALWAELARRYKDEPTVGAYDLLNEPNWGFADPADKNGCKESGNAPLKALYERTIKAVREIDDKHLIFIEGNCWGNNYQGLLPIADPNLGLSFHKYWNYTTRDTIEPYLKLRDDFGLPLWLGESGENSNDWTARTIETVEAENIGWAWWPWKKFRENNPVHIWSLETFGVEDHFKDPVREPNDALRRMAEEELMALATKAVRFENTTKHPDFVDALFRAAHSDQAIPYPGQEKIGRNGGRIFAVDYDMGRNGVAYFDTVAGNYYVSTGGERTPGNKAGHYRNDGVDIGLSMDIFPHIFDIEPGEWLRYTIEVERAGIYSLTFFPPQTGFSIQVNGAPETQKLDRIKLNAGTNVIVLKALTPSSQLNELLFEAR